MIEIRFNDDHGVLVDHAGDNTGMVEVGRREDGSRCRRFRERPSLIFQMKICVVCSILPCSPESRIKTVMLIEESPTEPGALSHMLVSVGIDAPFGIAIPDLLIGEIRSEVFHADDDRSVAKSWIIVGSESEQRRIDVFVGRIEEAKATIGYGNIDSGRIRQEKKRDTELIEMRNGTEMIGSVLHIWKLF